MAFEDIAVGLATDPSPVCIDPGSADPVVVQVGIIFHSSDGNPENKPKTVNLQSPELHSLLSEILSVSTAYL